MSIEATRALPRSTTTNAEGGISWAGGRFDVSVTRACTVGRGPGTTHGWSDMRERLSEHRATQVPALAMNIDAMIDNLHSHDLEIQTRAVESLAEEVARAARACVDALARGPSRHLVAERLHRFGTVIVPPLRHLVKSDADPEARLLGAVVLLQFGARDGVSFLMDAVRDGHSDAPLAATWLAIAGVAEVAELLHSALIASDLRDVDRDLAYLDALHRLGREPPAAFVERARHDAAPWQLRCLGLGQGANDPR